MSLYVEHGFCGNIGSTPSQEGESADEFVTSVEAPPQKGFNPRSVELPAQIGPLCVIRVPGFDGTAQIGFSPLAVRIELARIGVPEGRRSSLPFVS